MSDLIVQMAGASWIAEREPIDLATSQPSDASVPSGIERPSVVERMAAEAFPGVEPVIEGLFLKRENRYLALVAGKGRMVVGLRSGPIAVRFPEASPWRRLSRGVGRWLQG